jgi:hypothetical protein
MNNELLITVEILFVVVAPLLILYIKGRWPLRTIILCLLTIPILWYLTYSPIHELSHIKGTYLVGGKVTFYKLIPSFWKGEFGHAWITSEGLSESWRHLISTSFPYLLDVVCLIVGIFMLHKNYHNNAFIIGLVFMLLCLRPSFDFVCETIALLTGNRGDLFYIDKTIGNLLTWLFLLLSIGLSLFSIIKVLSRFIGAPQHLTMRGNLTILKRKEFPPKRDFAGSTNK